MWILGLKGHLLRILFRFCSDLCYHYGILETKNWANYGQFTRCQGCQTSSIPFLYNMDTSVMKTLGFVSLKSL